jgi:predicted small lipoprotein YifL
MTHLVKMLSLAVVVLCLAGTLAACGKKMQPTPPEGSTFPRQYPKPQ